MQCRALAELPGLSRDPTRSMPLPWGEYRQVGFALPYDGMAIYMAADLVGPTNSDIKIDLHCVAL